MNDFNFVTGMQGHFKFLNGDQYYGEYAVDRILKKVYRHGCGTYVTSNCCIYKGKWECDKLENAYIKYPKNHRFCGKLNSEGGYECGTYDVDDCCKLHLDFEDNEHIEFQDRNDNFWKTKMEDTCILVTNEGVQ